MQRKSGLSNRNLVSEPGICFENQNLVSEPKSDVKRKNLLLEPRIWYQNQKSEFYTRNIKINFSPPPPPPPTRPPIPPPKPPAPPPRPSPGPIKFSVLFHLKDIFIKITLS